MGELYKLDFSNGKSYIGITTANAASRFHGHRSFSKRSKLLVYAAWRKHGEPRMTVLAVLEDRELASTEIRAIAAYGTLTPNGYNMTPGGEESPMKDPLIAKKVSESMKGRKHSDEIRAAQSMRMMGNKKLLGHSHSEASRAKMSASRKGQKRGSEFAARLSAAMKGKPKSPEHTAKMPAAARAWVAKMKLEQPEKYAAMVAKRGEAIKAGWAAKLKLINQEKG